MKRFYRVQIKVVRFLLAVLDTYREFLINTASYTEALLCLDNAKEEHNQ